MNCQSIRNKRTDLTECIDYFKPDVILGTESWLSIEHKNAEIFPEGYHKNVYRKDRNKNGGGVFVAFHDRFETLEVENSDSKCEVVWAEMQTKSKNAIIGCYHSPPSADITSLEELDKSINNIRTKSKEKILILSGDFNLPHINWSNQTVKNNSSQINQHHKLLEISQDADKTRLDNNLDLYFTNYPSLIKSCDTAPGFSDHDLVVTDSDIKPIYNKTKRRKIFKFKKADWSNINNKMEGLSNKTLKRKLQKNIRNAHWNYVNETLNKSLEDGNNKSFWKYIKAKRNDSIGVAAIKSNGVLYHDNATKAELLNAQFKSVFT
ncbi:hypothetical protein KUTeg_009317, partial [Tegillarca granosa]